MRRIDVGVWTALAIGTDGGLGSNDLCRPLEQEAQVFGAVGAEGGPPIRIRIDLEFPDQDLTRSTAEVEVRDAEGDVLHGDPARTVERAVTTMTELLRSLGGEATAASVELDVRCELGSSAPSTDGGAGLKDKETPLDASGAKGPDGALSP
jgi:hypothetical protein